MARFLQTPTSVIITSCTLVSFLLAALLGLAFIQFPTTLPPEQLPALPSPVQSIEGIFASVPPRPHVRTVDGQLYHYPGVGKVWRLEERSLILESNDRCSDKNLRIIKEVTGLIISCRMRVVSAGGVQFKEWIHENKPWQPEELPVFLDNGEPCSEKNVQIIEQSAGKIVSCHTVAESHFSYNTPVNTYSFALTENGYIWRVIELPFYMGIFGLVLIVIVLAGFSLGLLLSFGKHMAQAIIYLRLEKERKANQKRQNKPNNH